MRDDLRVCRPDVGSVGRRALAALLADIRSSGAVPVLVRLPVHPRLSTEAAPILASQQPYLADLARVHQALLLDATSLLDADQFADAVHPDRAGRSALSEWLGRHLPPVPER